ncbi:hypothetical protein K439DRAFT_1638274 [Ramaria rubella]|nr:hypothetical protein K439DRAFT_1641671 [Ramaria rubella]KAF8579120.1 hypothetical protein K439DRAFT_1638274 [Ramaria rubella]
MYIPREYNFVFGDNVNPYVICTPHRSMCLSYKHPEVNTEARINLQLMFYSLLSDIIFNCGMMLRMLERRRSS